MLTGKFLRNLPLFELEKQLNPLPAINIIRHGHFLRGKPPGIALSLEQRLKKGK